MPSVEETLRRIKPLDRETMAIARHHQNNLAKRLNTLGRLEELATHLAGVGAMPFFQVRGKAIIVVGADHGVAQEGVSAFPQKATVQRMANILAGGAAVTVLARLAQARVVPVDVGMIEGLVGVPGLTTRRARAGGRNMTKEAALTVEEAQAAIETGIAIVQEEIDRGADIIGAGAVGVGAETAAAALLSAFTGRSPEDTVPAFAEDTDAVLEARRDAVRRALALHQPDPGTPLDALAAVGGLDIAALTGVVLGAAARRRPVVMDGFVAGAAALIASGLSARALDYVFIAQRVDRPPYPLLASHLQKTPLSDLGLCDGDGAGAALGIAVLEAAARAQAETATFSQAGLSGPME